MFQVRRHGFLLSDTGKMYKGHITCPKCAKKYGKNYVVIVAKVG